MDLVSLMSVFKVLGVVIASLIAGNTVITGAINGAFNVQKGWVKHLISWLVAVVAGVITAVTGGLGTVVVEALAAAVAAGTLTAAGSTWITVAIGAVCGLVAGGASNGLYDWEAVSSIVDKFYNLFGHGTDKAEA